MGEFPDKLIGWTDIARGVGELIVDEAKDAVRWLARQTQHLQHEGLSEHFQDRGSGPALDRELYDQQEMFYVDPTHQNRWDGEGRDVPDGF